MSPKLEPRPAAEVTRQWDHLDRVDVLRAVAILMVFLCHTLPYITGKFEYELLGYGGVALFFVISGFCIHLSYLKEREKAGTGFSLRRFTGMFWWRRFWRIYPPYLAALIFFWLLEGRHHPLPASHFWSHLFLVHNFTNASFYSIAPPFWSLAVEWQFYLLYPFFLWLLNRVGLRVALAAVLIETILLRGFAFYHQDWQQPLSPVVWHSTFVLFFDWTLGILIAELWTRKKAARGLELLAMPAALLLGLLASIPGTLATTFTLAAIASAGFMSLYLRPADAPGIPERVLAWLGISSYSFYLWHQPLVGRLAHWFHQLGAPDTFAANVFFTGFVALLCLVMLSWISYQILEKPGIQIGRYLWSKWFARKTVPVGLPGKNQSAENIPPVS